MSNNPSSTTKVLPVRVENELMEELDALTKRLADTTRTELARQALRRGLDLITAELAQRPRAKAKGKQRKTSPEKLPASKAPPGRDKRKTAPAKAPAARAQSKAQSKAGFDLAGFATQVLVAARRTRTGRFGEDRVFINHAWRRFKLDQRPKDMDLTTFKLRLVEANRARYLSLVRADMAPSLDQKDVKESEIRYLSATFHFLCI